VQQADGVALFARLRAGAAARPPAEAGQQAAREQKDDSDDLAARVDPQRVIGRGEEEVVGEGRRQGGHEPCGAAADGGGDGDHRKVDDDHVL
jgi:hypothetical protein